MLKYKKKHMKKVTATMLAALTFCLPLTSYADTIQRADDWALNDLYEAEVSGILPLDWQQTLHNTVSPEQMLYIIRGIEEKLALAGLEKEVEIVSHKGNTRQQVLDFYYQVLLQYSSQLDLGKDMLDYMTNHKIVAGDKSGNINGEKPCTVQEATLFANRLIKDVYKQIDAGAKGYLWEVSNGKKKVYLLGTVHIADESLYPFNDEINDILQNVSKVAFEVDFNDQKGQAYLLQKQMYTDSTTLQDHLPKEVYEEVVDVMGTLGLQASQVNKYKPWTIANAMPSLVMSKAQTQVNQAAASMIPVIDSYMYTKSIINDKEIIELEGYAYQADLFDAMPMELQIENLKDSLHLAKGESVVANTSLDTMQYWVDAFKEGDIEGFIESYPKDEMLKLDNQFTQLLFSKRDKGMTDQIVQYLNAPDTANYLVVVGAGHMIGETGIVESLKKLGYKVKPFYE